MAKRLKDVWLDEQYLALIHEFPLKPIESDKELRRAIEMINKLIDRGIENLPAGEDAYLDVLSDIVHKYETEHHPIEPVAPTQLLAFLIESKGVSQREVAEAAGMKESSLSDLLAGRRAFNRNHIERLARYFLISPAAFFPK